MKLALSIIATLLLLAGPLGAAASQVNYALDWWTLDGGGGTSTGGDFSLIGSIGQPEAGFLQGGEFNLQGGFFVGGKVSTTGNIYLPVVVRSGG
jgi:hypothetical protein